MMFLRRRLWALVRDQAEVIKMQRLQMERMQLEYARNVRDLIEGFFVVQQSGEDVRDELLEGLRDLQDEVARLEEHSEI